MSVLVGIVIPWHGVGVSAINVIAGLRVLEERAQEVIGGVGMGGEEWEGNTYIVVNEVWVGPLNT